MSKNADRARQFMPFAALTGFYSLVREQESIPSHRKERTEEECFELSRKILQLRRGSEVKIKYYRSKSYYFTEGEVEYIDHTFRTLTVAKNKISFDDIYEIDVL